MLLLDSRVYEIDGITLFPDHANGTWYYQPLSPHLTTIKDPTTGLDNPQFLLAAFRGQAGDGAILNFDVNVGASQDQLDAVARKLAEKEHLTQPPPLAPVPLVGGSVRLLALGKDSVAPLPVDGTPAPAATPGPQFVLSMQHNTQPALFGSNQASFSVRLDADGLSMVEACLDGEILPIAVIYSLQYWGLRPAYAMKLSIDWDRVQKHLDEKFSTGIFFVSADIENVVDELTESRAIVLESDTFVPEGGDSKSIIDRRDAALAQLRNMITDNFFTVTLPPYKPEDKPGWEKALDAIGKFAASSSAVAAGGPAASTAASLSFSYNKLSYQRIDRKNLDVDFSERTTIVRSIYPQAHLAGLARALTDSGQSRDRFVKHVDLDSDWFARRRLKVVYRPDLGASEIAAINVRATYGDRPLNKLLTAPGFETDFEWLSQTKDGQPVRDVEVAYEVQFAGVDTTERPGSLSFTEPPTTDLELSIRPEEDVFSIKPIPVLAENFPWDRYTSVEVHLRYTDEAHQVAQQDLIRLTEQDPDGQWKMFVLDRTRTTYEVKLVYRASDNRDHVVEFVPSDEEQVTVRNPFPSRRVVEVTPSAIDWTQVKEAFVDLRYADPANHVLVEDSFSFAEGTASQRFLVDLRDPSRTEVFYTVTFIMVDHSSVVVPTSVTRDRRIAIRPDMKGRRSVAIRPPVDFVARKVRRVTVDLRFEDLLAGLSFADSVSFLDGTEEHQFEYDVADDSRNQFEYRTTVVFENGLVKTVDWTASDATEITAKLG